MECCAYCTASNYAIKPFYEAMRTTRKATLYRDVVHVAINKDVQAGDAFFFSFGVAVFWGIPKITAMQFLQTEMLPFELQHIEDQESDEFTFIYGESAKIIEDEIILPNDEMLTKLALSYGIAQSVKMGTFETKLQKIFNTSRQIPENLAKQGRISLSRSEIRRKMGELFIERTSINLHMDVLDTPEFFWEYPELESLYKLMASYLDLRPRLEVLNQRLDVIHGLFEMLGSELNHSHSSRLEWIIIILIIIEVVVSFLRDVFQII